MKKLIIIGAGAYGREIAWMIERINAIAPTWDLLGFVDDAPDKQGTMIDEVPVLGTLNLLEELNDDHWVVCSVGTGKIRAEIIGNVMRNSRLHAATIIDPSVIIAKNCSIADGCVISANAVLSVGVTLKEHAMVNVGSCVGHDSVLGVFCTIHPGVNISGNVEIGARTDVGTGSKIIQGLSICSDCILGAGAVVVRDITEPGTYVGIPACKICGGVKPNNFTTNCVLNMHISEKRCAA